MLKIAEHWFERRTVDDSITLLWEPHVAPLLRCNIWHVRGRTRDLVIDTGMGVVSLIAAARDLFERPLCALATHSHLDHVGGLHEFPERLIHQAEAAALAQTPAWGGLVRGDYSAELSAYFETVGYALPPLLITALPYREFDPHSFRAPPTQATRTLNEGDVIDLDNRHFEVLHLPGHSPGSIGLWEARSGTLFAGDAIYDGPLLDRLPGSDPAVYRCTLERLRTLPVTVVHGGHDPSFGRARLHEIIESYLRAQSVNRI